MTVQKAKESSPLLLTDTAVEIHTASVRPSYGEPWQVNRQQHSRGSGFHIGNRRILTNAHCVEDATMLQVVKQGDPKKYCARALCVAHDVDLAVLTSEEEKFWEDLPTATLSGGFPELYS